MRYLTTSEYEQILLSALRQHALPDTVAHRLIESRFPMDAGGLISEANGRGLVVDMADVSAFLAEYADDFEDVTVDNVLFTAAIVEAFLVWSVMTERARLNGNGRHLQRPDADAKLRAMHQHAAAPNN